MSTTTSHISPSRNARILRFWHKVEFFIPFDLQRQVLEAKDAESSVRRFSEPQLQRADTQTLWQVSSPAGRKLSGFDVYLGIFDKTELTRVTKRVIHEALTPDEEYDQEERGEFDGHTCFARIKISAQGEPLLDEVSASTAPWALGRIQQQGLAGLDFDAFQAGIETLKDALNNFRANRANTETSPKSSADLARNSETSATTQPLTASELLTLNKLFYDWAGYCPEYIDPNAPVIVIRAKNIEDKDPAPKASEVPSKEEVIDDEDDEAPSSEDNEIDILNSFFAQDIARAIASMEKGITSSALDAYLTPVPDSARIDLYQSAGRQQIAAMLQPSNLNSGHWPDPPCHTMSLMQQFAINSVFEQLPMAGVFSVNGPPGTGKTTLLRDIFAENLVRRARALAKFETPGGAFLPESATVNFKGAKDPCKIALLREEIAGYEMIVASTNNAAVENISRDLPKTDSLGKHEKHIKKGWRDEYGKATFGYLQQVAHNVAAKNGTGEYKELSVDDKPWGLISCALGNKRNRTTFVDRISFAGARPSEKTPKHFNPEHHQSIWTWRDHYRGINYADARSAFLKADRAVKERIEQLDRYAKLQVELRGHTLASYTEAAAQHEQETQEILIAAQASLSSVDDEWQLCKSQIELLKSDEQLIEDERPGWWARLLKRPTYLNYRDDVAGNHRKQREWLHRRLAIEEPRLIAQKSSERAVAAHHKAQLALIDRQAAWHRKQEKWEKLKKDFPGEASPAQLDDLEQETWQINGLWRDEALNKLRSELFIATLQLHEAWLADVLRKRGRFGSNLVALCHLLSGKRLQETEHALAIWRSLFMIAPVASSTFASFANQFRDLGPNSLGWLFIDEAGQAVPQAAVGALWRAKQAVIVGDPLQIEPEFTVPIKLIEALAKSSDLPSEMNVAPHCVSVQNLADNANYLGAWISTDDGRQWIGSPLRVHRRCVDPMFSIANMIAYEGKMIFFDPTDPEKRLPPKDSLNMGSSAWVHAPGSTNGNKQSVAMQIDLVFRALFTLYQRENSLPPIYIISPFKRIKDELINRISKLENWNALVVSSSVGLPNKTELHDWCKKRIGTIHTFQGKEESIVWVVLGCDENTHGAADWAASKPNLLNVALTRAKHRFFMIGDVTLWGGLRYFITAGPDLLPRISSDEFLQRMNHTVPTIDTNAPTENSFNT